MGIVSIIMIAIGLSMDAFAVSISNGILIRELRARHIFKIAFFFGGFQALMPMLGWAAGYRFKDYIVSFDHWIAFGLLSFIGAKMILEALNGKKPEDPIKEETEYLYEVALAEHEGVQLIDDTSVERSRIDDNRYLLMLAVATSIDALAVGVSFAFLKVSIVNASLLIGLTTFVICAAGVVVGKRFGELFRRQAELAGGVILILIGLKILVEHLGILSTIIGLL